MKLFTKEIDQKLFAQYSKGSDLSNQMVVAKIFNPYGRGTWYLINSDEDDPDYLWAIVDLFEVEVGSVSRKELESIKIKPFNFGLERDLSFTPRNAEEVFKGLLSGKTYAKGGKLKYDPSRDVVAIAIKDGVFNKMFMKGDFLGGAYQMESGGVLKDYNYVSPRNIIFVRLKSGEDIKPVNGFYIRKNASGTVMTNAASKPIAKTKIKSLKISIPRPILLTGSPSKSPQMMKFIGTFSGKDLLRPAMTFVQIKEGSIVATDANKLIRIIDGSTLNEDKLVCEAAKCKTEKPEDQKFPSVSFVLKSIDSEFSESYDMVDLYESLMQVRNDDLKNKVSKTLRVIELKLENQTIYFNITLLLECVKGCLLLGWKRAFISYSQGRKAIVFTEEKAEGRVNEVSLILLMPILGSDATEKVTITPKMLLEQGGMMADGGEVFIPTTYLDYNPDYLVGTNTMYEMFADGGMMAKGGELYKIQEKYKYDVRPKWEDEKFQTGGRYFLTFKNAQDFKKKLSNMSSSIQYKVVKVDDEMADGGSIPEGYHQMPDGSIMADSAHMAKGGVVYLYYGGEQPDEMMNAANESEAASIAMKMGAEHYDFVAQMGKGGKIREFDDVLIISKNKLGMVEAIADNIYYVTTPFGESFEAALDDLQKVKSFAQGGAMEHRIYSGDSIKVIYDNRLIVEDSNGDIMVIDLSTEPQATRYNIQRITNENTIESAKEFIESIKISKPVTTKGLYEILTSPSDNDLRNGLNRKTMVVSKGAKWTDKKFLSLARDSFVRGGFTLTFFNDDEDDSINFGELISIVEQYKDSELPIIAQVPGAFPRKFVRNAGFDKLSKEFFIEVAGEYVPPKYAKGGSLQGHGFEVGDLIVEDLGGYIRVVSEDGKDFFITLRTGDRETEAPLPFKHGGKVKHSDVTRLATKTNESGDEVVDLTEFYEGGGKIDMSAQQIADIVIEDLKYKIANDDEVESAYYEVKDFFNLGRNYENNQKLYEAVVIVRNWMKTKKVGDEFYEGGGNVPKVFDVPAQFLDSEGKRKNDRKTIKELTDFVLGLPQTKSIYYNDNLGGYTPSRKKLHAEIINKFKKEVVCINNDKPIAIFMGGSPASGKSSFLRKYSPFLLKEEILKIDADEIRAMLPEYEGWNACQTHLETRDIVNILLSNKNIGIPCDFDIIYDGTMNSVTSYIPLMDILRKRGYKIFIVFMDNVPKDVIIKRALDRYKSSGRFVPLEVIEDFFSKGKTAFNELKKDVDGYMRIDGSSQDYKVLEEGGMKLPRDREYSKLGTKIKASDIPVSYKKGGLSKLY